MALFIALALSGCDNGNSTVDSGPLLPDDAGTSDAGPLDSGRADSGRPDSGSPTACEGAGCEIVELSLGFENTCARRDNGQVLCWGYGQGGQLGDGLPDGAHSPGCNVAKEPFDCSSRPVLVSLTEPATALAGEGGLSHCALLGDDDELWCWGDMAYRVGTPREHARLSPEAVHPEGMPPVNGVVEVSEGWLHMCWRGAAGTLSCLGNNSVGQLGVGNKMERFVPGTVLTAREPATELTGVLEVDAPTTFGSFTCARNASNVYCWGNNSADQLGAATASLDTCSQDGAMFECSDIAVPVEGLDGSMVTQLSLGSSHACALLADGTVSCWGNNIWGQLARPVDVAQSAVPEQVAGLTGVASISAGANHTCALHTDGRVSCWGMAYLGQMGDGDATHDVCTAGEIHECSRTVVEVTGVDDATHLEVGRNHSCVIRESGQVWCWGSNDKHQLGNGTRSESSRVPVQALGL